MLSFKICGCGGRKRTVNKSVQKRRSRMRSRARRK